MTHSECAQRAAHARRSDGTAAQRAVSPARRPHRRPHAQQLPRQVHTAEQRSAITEGCAWCHLVPRASMQAGTFEERTVTEWAKERLTQLVKAASMPDVVVDDVTSVTGDANIFIVRGKKRCGLRLVRHEPCIWGSGPTQDCISQVQRWARSSLA